MPTIKYRAFLSYSHRDTAWAKWLHKALESYRIDKDLVGRQTAHGPIPKTLRPIFRDREDFSAGHSLTEQTRAALEASEFLIAVCSPNAARSTYVNEEIRSFKAMGRALNVIPLIVDGDPGDPGRECFPPAVRFKVADDGNLSNEPEEPIAADARPQGDGKEIAKQKIVAGLLSVGLDEIVGRAQRARKKRNLIRFGAVSGGTGVVALAAASWAITMNVASRSEPLELLNVLHQAADICDDAGRMADAYAVPDSLRIEMSLNCIEGITEGIDTMPKNIGLPYRFVSMFASHLAFLQRLESEGKLTPGQSKELRKAETLLARLKTG